MTIRPCKFCEKLPGTKAGPPALARCIAKGCEASGLAAETIDEWNMRNAAPRSEVQTETPPGAYWYERATARTSSGKPALWQNELTFTKPDTHEFIRNVRPLYLGVAQTVPDPDKTAKEIVSKWIGDCGGYLDLTFIQSELLQERIREYLPPSSLPSASRETEA